MTNVEYSWILLAVGSAFFAGLTSILAKCGIKHTDSTVATAIRTVVVLFFAWIMVFITGAQGGLAAVEHRTLLFLCLSGLATGASWLCYYRALQIGDVNKVVPVDKSSTVLSVIIAMIVFNETDSLYVKIGGICLIAVGTMLMITKKKSSKKVRGGKWFVYAVLSAVFAALTSVLGKIGVTGIDSTLATALRTAVVLVMAWFMVLVTDKTKAVKKIDGSELLFICLSGLATGASWLCYYKALQIGDVCVVVPIDKLSIVFTTVFARIVFKEKLTLKAFFGLLLIIAGTLLMTVIKK